MVFALSGPLSQHRRTMNSPDLRKHVIAMVADARMLPAAAYMAKRLAELNYRDDVEVVVFSDSAADLKAATEVVVHVEIAEKKTARPPASKAMISGPSSASCTRPITTEPSASKTTGAMPNSLRHWPRSRSRPLNREAVIESFFIQARTPE